MQPTPQDRRVDGSFDDDERDGNHDDDHRSDDNGTGGDAGKATPATTDLTVLDGLAERPPHEHAAVYEQVHAQLQNALSEINDA